MRGASTALRHGWRVLSGAVLGTALVMSIGCQIGCDGERAKPPENPKSFEARVTGDAGAVVPPPDLDVAGTTLRGFLDVPSGSLDHLMTAFAMAERGDATARTLIAVFGDSHTAGDSMTSRLRTTLQARFGDAGRGLVAAGRPPARHYYQRDVRYGSSGAWRSSVGGARGDVEPFGIAGLRVFGQRKGAQLWVETCAECQAGTRVSQFEIFYYSAPNHGTLKYRVDDAPWQELKTRTTAIEPPHPGRQVIAVPDGPHRLTLEHGGNGPIDLFGVALERHHAGIIVDSLGVVGRRLGSLRSWDWAIIGEQLATRDPRLVILQYGTNEADDPDLDLAAMAQYFDDTILRIRAAAPTSAILILGPPDMGVREGGRGCDRLKPKPTAGVIVECQWRTPSVLGEIIAVEQAAAIRNKVAFFNTFAAMGGADRMHEWVTADPKLAYKDHVHLSDGGYQIWADALSGALLAEYARWRRASHLPPSPTSTVPPPVAPSPLPSVPLPGALPGPAVP